VGVYVLQRSTRESTSSADDESLPSSFSGELMPGSKSTAAFPASAPKLGSGPSVAANKPAAQAGGAQGPLLMPGSKAAIVFTPTAPPRPTAPSAPTAPGRDFGHNVLKPSTTVPADPFADLLPNSQAQRPR
jgi:hypothetical protein